MYSFCIENFVSFPVPTTFYSYQPVESYLSYPSVNQSIPTFINFSYPPIPTFSQSIQNLGQYEPSKETHTQIERTHDSFQKTTKKQKNGCAQKMLRPKKNVESNISNQVFSYIVNEHKSSSALSKILKYNKVKIQLFYDYISIFTKNKKKYLSRKYLGDLCILTGDREQCIQIQNMKKLQFFSLQEFQGAIAYLIFHYLRSKCIINILTSTKLSSELRKEHLERKRQILAYLEDYIRPDFKYGFK